MGSEMCIRDSPSPWLFVFVNWREVQWPVILGTLRGIPERILAYSRAMKAALWSPSKPRGRGVGSIPGALDIGRAKGGEGDQGRE